MINKTLNTKFTFWEDKRFSNVSLGNLNLALIINKLKHYYLGDDEDINSRILLKSPAKKIVLTLAHRGIEIMSFQTNDSITFQIIEGKVRFQTLKKMVLLIKGEHLTLNEKVKYSLTTTEDSTFLMTIANKISQA